MTAKLTPASSRAGRSAAPSSVITCHPVDACRHQTASLSPPVAKRLLPARAGRLRCPMTGAALVLSVVDTSTGELRLVPIDVVALHRRSGRYPALCGTVVPAASLTTTPIRDCEDCAKQAQSGGGGGAGPRKPGRPPGAHIRWPRRRARHRNHHV